ncbi:unnamed protein product [Lactuca saligna]|uniref:Uncharacterized protein n=1 Tax=Lactuca saligna TaxID=75948 RepID=A0AA35ZMV8_LACSI|nr:unnamed protein product [Lactuca saligna]
MIVMCAPSLELTGVRLSSVDLPTRVPRWIPGIEGYSVPGTIGAGRFVPTLISLLLSKRYGFQPEDSVTFPVLPTHKVHINQLVPNGISKVVAFEMMWRANGINPNIWVFRHFFHFAAVSSGESYTCDVRKHSHVLVVGLDACWGWYEFIVAASWKDVRVLHCVERVDFIDVLAKKWVRSLRYREVELIDRVFPSFPFCNEAFIVRASPIQDAERRRAVVEPSRKNLGKKSLWKTVRREVGWGEYTCGECSNGGANLVESEPGVVLETSERLNVAGGGSNVNEGSHFLRFGHIKSPTVGDSGLGSSNGVVFFPSWYLKNDSRLSLFEAVIDFTKNVIPLGTQSETTNYSLTNLVGFFRFAIAKGANFFAKGANRLERFLVVDGDLAPFVKENHALCSENVALKNKNFEFKGNVSWLDVLDSEKKVLEENVTSLDHDKLALGVVVGRLKQENEGTVIRFEEIWLRHWPLNSRQVKAIGFGIMFHFEEIWSRHGALDSR